MTRIGCGVICAGRAVVRVGCAVTRAGCAVTRVGPIVKRIDGAIARAGMTRAAIGSLWRCGLGSAGYSRRRGDSGSASRSRARTTGGRASLRAACGAMPRGDFGTVPPPDECHGASKVCHFNGKRSALLTVNGPVPSWKLNRNGTGKYGFQVSEGETLRATAAFPVRSPILASEVKADLIDSQSVLGFSPLSLVPVTSFWASSRLDSFLRQR